MSSENISLIIELFKNIDVNSSELFIKFIFKKLYKLFIKTEDKSKLINELQKPEFIKQLRKINGFILDKIPKMHLSNEKTYEDYKFRYGLKLCSFLSNTCNENFKNIQESYFIISNQIYYHNLIILPTPLKIQELNECEEWFDKMEHSSYFPDKTLDIIYSIEPSIFSFSINRFSSVESGTEIFTSFYESYALHTKNVCFESVENIIYHIDSLYYLFNRDLYFKKMEKLVPWFINYFYCFDLSTHEYMHTNILIITCGVKLWMIFYEKRLSLDQESSSRDGIIYGFDRLKKIVNDCQHCEQEISDDDRNAYNDFMKVIDIYTSNK